MVSWYIKGENWEASDGMVMTIRSEMRWNIEGCLTSVEIWRYTVVKAGKEIKCVYWAIKKRGNKSSDDVRKVREYSTRIAYGQEE